jgi:allophanate hydrolase
VTLVGPAFSDRALIELGERYRARRPRAPRAEPPGPGEQLLAVVGAHLTGMPLSSELTAVGARLVRTAVTAHDYRLFALTGAAPEKPGLQRVLGFRGTGIEVELWALHADAFGEFIKRVRRPLAIGSIELEDGTHVNGFVCEPWGLKGAKDITQFGGWRRYTNAK